MRKCKFWVIWLLGLGLLIAGCAAEKSKVSISTDVTKYSPFMSSVQGIGLTPDFTTAQKDVKVQYHWNATSGEFFVWPGNREKEKITDGGKVTWAPDLAGLSQEGESITITLRVEEVHSGNVLAETTLMIEQEKGFYTVKQ